MPKTELFCETKKLNFLLDRYPPRKSEEYYFIFAQCVFRTKGMQTKLISLRSLVDIVTLCMCVTFTNFKKWEWCFSVQRRDKKDIFCYFCLLKVTVKFSLLLNNCVISLCDKQTYFCEFFLMLPKNWRICFDTWQLKQKIIQQILTLPNYGTIGWEIW